ncbi:MAG: GGDEF domain-containing protein [Clostridia bacterium]|nr:GGDEF domain-containing protein [Clostridia bacterium]
MATAIHIELNILFFLILVRIVYQSAKNENQQMRRVLFRYTAYGIMSSLVLDTLWKLLDGKRFPLDVAVNQIVNALFLASGIVIGCVWYLYVLETLGYRITRKLTLGIMSPAIVFTTLNLISIKTGWIFYISEENVYMRGPLFWLQTLAALSVLLSSLVHCLIRLFNGRKTVPRRVVLDLIGFYIIPVVGTLASMPITGMPGTWTCAAVSIILMYIDSQDREIVRDTLTGLNNRKMLPSVFEEYTRQVAPGSVLYLYMMDLDDFKSINDTYGHLAGDEALKAASRLFAQAADGKRAMVARVGGDEFLILAMLPGNEAAAEFKDALRARMEQYNEEHSLPYLLNISVGCCAYERGESLEAFMARADEALYREKRVKKVGR